MWPHAPRGYARKRRSMMQRISLDDGLKSSGDGVSTARHEDPRRFVATRTPPGAGGFLDSTGALPRVKTGGTPGAVANSRPETHALPYVAKVNARRRVEGCIPLIVPRGLAALRVERAMCKCPSDSSGVGRRIRSALRINGRAGITDLNEGIRSTKRVPGSSRGQRDLACGVERELAERVGVEERTDLIACLCPVPVEREGLPWCLRLARRRGCHVVPEERLRTFAHAVIADQSGDSVLKLAVGG